MSAFFIARVIGVIVVCAPLLASSVSAAVHQNVAAYTDGRQLASPCVPTAVTVVYDEQAVADGVDANLVSYDVYAPCTCAPGATDADVGVNNNARVGNAAVPTIFYVHGGAFIIGDKASKIATKSQWLTSLGYVFVSINYRLSPANWTPDMTPPAPDRVKYPTHPADVAAAMLHYVRTGVAAQHCGDPTRSVLFGHSAGAAVVATLAFNRRFLGPAAIARVQSVISIDSLGYNVTEQIVDSVSDSNRNIYLNAFGETNVDGLWEDASPSTWAAQPSTTPVPTLGLWTRGSSVRRARVTAVCADAEANGHACTLFDVETPGAPTSASAAAYALSYEWHPVVPEWGDACAAPPTPLPDLSHEGINAAVGLACDWQVTPEFTGMIARAVGTDPATTTPPGAAESASPAVTTPPPGVSTSPAVTTTPPDTTVSTSPPTTAAKSLSASASPSAASPADEGRDDDSNGASPAANRTGGVTVVVMMVAVVWGMVESAVWMWW